MEPRDRTPEHLTDETTPVVPLDPPASERRPSAPDRVEDGPTLDPPATTSVWPLRWVGTRLVPVLLLLGIIAWAGLEVRDLMQGRRSKQPAVGPTETPGVGAVGDAITGDMGGESDAWLDEPSDEDEGPSGGGEPVQRLGELLGHRVERYDPATGETETIKLGASALKTGVVTVVNLWATWCKACKEEFPGFQQIFVRGARDSATWDREVRFVTLMLSDTTLASAAYRQFRTSFPAVLEFLVDRRFDPIEESLKKRSLLPASGDLPVTFLLDCKRRVRWFHLGALDAVTFGELDREIRARRQELGTTACKSQKRAEPRVDPPNSGSAGDTGPQEPSPGTTTGGETAPPALRSKCNLNGKCDAKQGEDSTTCPKDCPPKLGD